MEVGYLVFLRLEEALFGHQVVEEIPGGLVGEEALCQETSL